MVKLLPKILQPAAMPPVIQSLPSEAETNPSSTEHDLSDLAASTLDSEPGIEEVAISREKWNYPRINTWRLAAIFFAFFNFGLNDASYGALLPYVCQQLPIMVFRQSISLSSLLTRFSPD